MDDTGNWKPDPFGHHQLRFFSADGKPTLLVMDGEKRSYDKPPVSQGEGPQTTDQPSQDPSMPEPRVSRAAHAPPIPAVAPASDTAVHLGPNEVTHAQVSIPAVGLTDDPTESRRRFVPEIGPRPEMRVGYPEQEIMGRPLKIAYAIVLGALVVSILGLAYVHLHHSGDGHSTRAAPPTSTLAPTTTTTSVLPPTLSPSADAAATALVSSWSTNNRSGALTVATPTAVATLFSVPYASGLALARGCSTSFSPIVCTYGPPGGASPTDHIFEIMVSQVSGGWYVSSVRIEN